MRNVGICRRSSLNNQRTTRTAHIALACLLAFFSLRNARADFSIQNIQANPDGSITLTWPVTPTFTYHVMYADAPDSFWQEFPDGQLTAATNDFALRYTDTTAPAVSQRFYKVKRDPAQVIMTLVLDVSGSMDPSRGCPPQIPFGDCTGTGGGIALPVAVQTFIANFDDNIDKVAMVKFSTVQKNVVFTGTFPSTAQPTQPFRAAISNAVSALTYSGATFSQGGLTNALVMENNAFAPSVPAVVKVVVYFTDGGANIVQDTLNCPAPTLLNFGGIDPPNNAYLVFDPVTGNATVCGATQFNSASAGGLVPLTGANIRADAIYRAVQVTNDLRANKIIVFSVGLLSAGNTMFLQQIANDPATPGYVPTSYDGVAIVVNDPTQLLAALQTIASQILSRAAGSFHSMLACRVRNPQCIVTFPVTSSPFSGTYTVL